MNAIVQMHVSASLIAVLAAAAGPAHAGRFVATFESGRQVAGESVDHWARPGEEPRLNGVPLLDAADHVRWLYDVSLFESRPGPAAFVEFVSGDRLPGVVVAACNGKNQPSSLSTLPYLVVQPLANLKDSRNGKVHCVRVAAALVRRIASGGSQSTPYEPNTLRCRNGRQLRFRRMRLQSDSVCVLLERGMERIPFEEIAELDFPAVDPWESYFDEVAALSPGLDDRLFQLETTAGLVVTASTARFRAMPYNDRDDADRWYHLVHPAWSLEAFTVPHGEVYVRRYFNAHEVPLTRIFPMRSANRSFVHADWRMHRNRNVFGGPLCSGGRLHGWGFGVHGDASLLFPVPATAQSFQTRIGLDQSVGGGGCVRTRASLQVAEQDDPRKPRNESDVSAASPTLVGSQSEPFALRIPFPSEPVKSRQLALFTDPVNQGFPAGADPLDIRDAVDWLEPVITFDRDELAADVRRRWTRHIPALQGWLPAEKEPPAIELLGRWDAEQRKGTNYRFAVRLLQFPLTLAADVGVEGRESRLLVAVSRPAEQSDAAVIHIRVDGERVAEHAVPERYSGDEEPVPLVLPLDKWSGRRVRVEIELRPADQKAKSIVVDWRKIAVEENTLAETPSIPVRGAHAHHAVGLWDKEAQNIWLELQTAAEQEAYADVCRLIVGTPSEVLNTSVPVPGNPESATRLADLIVRLIGEHAEAARHLKQRYGPLATLRLNTALAEGDATMIDAVSVQFRGTQAAAKADAWLGDRALSRGHFDEAVGCYQRALNAVSTSRRPAIAARLRLSRTMLNRSNDAREETSESTPNAIPITDELLRNVIEGHSHGHVPNQAAGP